MSKLKEFFYPENIDEALEILRDDSRKASIIAGGTSVSLSMDDQVEALVDITRMNLDYIKEGGGYILVGATTVIEEIARSSVIKKLGDGMVSEAANQIASRPLRNVITLGGNIVQLKSWSDMPVALLALDASIKILGEGERMVPAEDFFKEHPKKHISRDEIVTEVMFPKTPENSGGAYIKFSKTVGDYSIVTVGCYLEFEDEICSLARIAIGSANPLPQRCRVGEILLENQQVSPDLIEKVAKTCRENVSSVSNIWGTAEYKSYLIENLIKQALTTCIENHVRRSLSKH